ncbi:MAG: 30S ribosomal protein S17 [Planctomycetes bacterium]|nr:30S ribosomal protein S17 [Planctomycetota bacterium]
MSFETGGEASRSLKLITGIVTSDKMRKTRCVKVVRLERHAKYGKYVRRHTTYKVHDETEVSKLGDTVRIAETRPISRTKHWRLVEVVSKSRYAHVPLAELPEDVAARGGSPGEGAQPITAGGPVS